jgi:formylglycine-generating enzyme required for sulfatase activity/tRNA A-37 threonylcarbamoyl transferase component Bud32
MAEYPHIPGYRIERELGKGSMTTVYLAVQENLDRLVAIKVLDPELLRDENIAKRFIKEAQAAAKLSHPNITTIHDVGRTGQYYYIVMEYLANGSLQDRIRRGPLPAQESLTIIRQVASALQYAHDKGYIHSDIKPENILFRKDGIPVLVDFGIARAMGEASKLAMTSVLIGTPYYMSPEQGRGQEVDARSDLYSLGIVLYEMLTGKVPYEAENTVGIVIKHIQEPVTVFSGNLSSYQPLFEKLLAKDPDQRFQTAGELLVAIDVFSAGVQNFAPQEPKPPQKAAPPPRPAVVKKTPTPSKMPRSAGAIRKSPVHISPADKQRKLVIGLLLALMVLLVVLAIEISKTPAPGSRAHANGAENLEMGEPLAAAGAEINHPLADVKQVQDQEPKPLPGDTPRKKEDTSNLEIEMVAIPGGTFQMGSDSGEADEKPVHNVTVSPFYMGKTEVTVGQWKKFVEASGYRSEAESGDGAYIWNKQKWEKKIAANWNNPGFNQDDNHPVTCISWQDCQEYIKWLNMKTGKRYRLPSEAEWEYACRAGTTGERYGNLDAIAWYFNNSGQTTHPVGQKQANGFGLFDMLGNVWEWCQDWYGGYSGSSQANHTGPATGSLRVDRGGGWSGGAGILRSANRGRFDPGYRYDSLGFRLASGLPNG